ncbi:MAG TPA: hypothetical protein VGM88_30955 [Kofleriaceae bacterium]|jgi:mono/diheme cytochrome c family protein
MRRAWLVSILLCACVAERDTPNQDPVHEVAPPFVATIGGGGVPVPTTTDPWFATCSHGYTDAVSQALCVGVAPPHLTSLAALRAQLATTASINGGFAMVGESTGLAVRVVTPLNPLSVSVFGRGAFDETTLTFARGQPFVELASQFTDSATFQTGFRFFLIRFHLTCEADNSCTQADLMLPSVEQNWTGYELYDETQLTNTTRDCLQCHQPDGAQGQRLLRMQEKDSPWEHWFNPTLPDRSTAFQYMHAGEIYAGQPVSNIGDPQNLVTMMEDEDTYDDQPNPFSSTTILNEVAEYGVSATWQGLYDNAAAGNAIPVPYYKETHLDADRAAAYAETYEAIVAGTAPKSALPDVRTIFSDDALPGMTIRPKAGADGHSILVQMCAQCHNAKLDQTLSRANFDATAPIDGIPGDERVLAAQRMNLPDTDPLKMPPPFLRELSDDERDAATSWLWQ